MVALLAVLQNDINGRRIERQIMFVALRFLSENFQGQCRRVALDPVFSAADFDPIAISRCVRNNLGQTPTDIRPVAIELTALKDGADIHGI